MHHQRSNAATKSLVGLRHPTTAPELKSFLGLCNVYRRFIQSYTTTAAPLYKLLGGDKPKKLPPLDEAQSRAFDELIQRVTNPPVLALPKANLQFSIDISNPRGWLSEAHRILVAHPYGRGKELFRIGPRMPRGCIRSNNVPSIPLWTAVHNPHRPPRVMLVVRHNGSIPSTNAIPTTPGGIRLRGAIQDGA